ncbi:MAG: GGDEF domain-containing protein [Thermoanaerobaculaceae bacterium]|jgi:diguanylate cyclase (GGDEF)-like protein|nr:GGDEF domain-containing protein [Thermoanaerobaculaceae bacterium]
MIRLAELVSLPADLGAPWLVAAAGVLALALLLWAIFERRGRLRASHALREVEERLARCEAQQAETSRSDPLTGLGNRRRLAEDLPGRLSMARRTAIADWPDHFTPRHGLGLFLVDIDGLRHINEAGGREAGDAVLRGVADALRQLTRQEDVAVRWGEDELAVVGSGMHREGLAALAAKILQAVGEVRVTGADGSAVPIRASLGFIPYPLIRRGSMSPEEWPLLVELARRVVLLAKRHGGGRGCGLVWAGTYQEEQDEAAVLASLLADPTVKIEGLELLELPDGSRAS